MNRTGSQLLVCVIAAGVCAAPGIARAAAFANPRIGGEQGHPTTDDATALYFNPGALVLSKGTTVYIDAMTGLAHASWEHAYAPGHDVPEPVDAKGANTGTAKLFEPVFAPSLGVTTRFDKLVLGAGFFAPFGGAGAYEKNTAFDGNTRYPGAVDGVARWFAVEGSQSSTYMTLGAAYQLGRLGIGLSGNLIHSSIDVAYASTANGSDDLTLEGRSLLQVSGWNGSFGLGAEYEAIGDKLWLGASYQAQPGLGKIALKGRLRSSYPGLTQDDQVKLEQTLPDVIRAGARFRPAPAWELRLFGDFTRWSVAKSQCITAESAPSCTANADGSVPAGAAVIRNVPRNYQNSFGVRAGASWFVEKPTELFVGAGFDSSAIPDSTLDPSTPDGNKIAGALGVRVRLGDHFRLAGAFTHIQMLPRDNTGKSARATFSAPSKSPDAGGKYNFALELLDVHVEYMF